MSTWTFISESGETRSHRQEKMDMQIIRERKFTASREMEERARSIFDLHCFADSSHPKGYISSIYYDTYHLKHYYEKIEGDNLKRKFRVRWYDDEFCRPDDTVSAFIEIKYRIGAGRRKVRHKISVPKNIIASAPLEDGRLLDLLYDHSHQVGDLIPLDLLPVVCISYERRRYVCKRTGGGVCIDVNIRGSRFNSNIFCAANTVRSNMIVCEFKDPGLYDLPLAEELYHAGFKLRSFSKYGECVSQILLGGAPQFLARHVI